MSDRDGGPAFPHSQMPKTSGEYTGVWEAAPGMSLRDWFAGAIIQGMLSNPNLEVDPAAGVTMEQCVAAAAYSLADVMLERRERHDG